MVPGGLLRIGFLFPHDFFDKGLQCRKIVLGNAPDDVWVSVVIRMTQYVSDIGNALPWNFRFLCFDVFGNPARRLADDFE
jgi:hypothetical protein